MCNEWKQERAWREYCEMMGREALDIVSEEPELPFGSMRPSDRAPILMAAPGGSRLDLVPWGWPGRGGKGLVINVQGENRSDPPQARGIAPFSSFFEFRGEKPPKSKFEFIPAVNEPLALAVVIRDGRYVLATTEPGDDVRQIHHRMPAVLRASDWGRYLTSSDWPADLIQSTPAGTLRAVQVR